MASKIVSQELVSERICEHVVDVTVPQVVEQLFVVPKIPSETEFCSAAWNRFLAVPVPVIEQFVDVSKFVFQDRIQRTLEQISDTPVPQVVEELVEVFTHFHQDGVQQRFAEQIFEIPAISLDEKISEKVANTHVQHVMNTVKVVMPRIITMTVQRKPVIGKNQPSRLSIPKHEDHNQHQDHDVVNFNRVSSEVVFPASAF